jgi:hypothetical protein
LLGAEFTIYANRHGSKRGAPVAEVGNTTRAPAELG